MKVSHIKISNILGIDDLEFEPGQVNVISGKNGSGKTSVLEAIKSIIEGGHDATLLRKGQDSGEIVLVLDNGTSIRKRVTGSKSPLEVTINGERDRRPTDVIKAITDTLAANPVEFLRAPKKDRVKVLMEAMPIELDLGRLSEISGIAVSNDSGVHALQLIQAVYKEVYDDRTGTNRVIKEKDSTINQLSLAMPSAPSGVSSDESEGEIEQRLAALADSKNAELNRIETKLKSIRETTNETVSKIREEAQAQIDLIKEAAQAKIEAARADLAASEEKASIVRERAIEKHAADSAPLKSTIESIRADRENAAKRQQAAETIKQMRAHLEELKKSAEQQTKALQDIEDYKSELISSLPIPGLVVIDGDIFRDGVQFDRLNTAQQVEIALEIAKLRSGELGLVCVDGAELLDSAAFDAFTARAQQLNLQLFVTRVTDAPLNLEIN